MGNFAFIHVGLTSPQFSIFLQNSSQALICKGTIKKVKLIMRLIWINSYGSIIGGCESYIFNTVNLLKERHVHSTLLYDPLLPAHKNFLSAFDAAFPLVDLKEQLKVIPHDLIFVNQWYKNEDFKVLTQQQAPVIRFYHDLWLFCLRRYKLTLIRKRPCLTPASCRCYPLLMSLQRSSNFLGFKINTLPGLRHAQHLNKPLDGFVVASRFLEEELFAAGFDPKKTHRISLYANEPAQNLPVETREKSLILFVGQLIYGKGVDLAIKAIPHTKQRCHLVIAGTGRQENEYRDLVKKLGLDAQVQFLGHVDQLKLEEWYQKALCVVLPVRAPEPFGLVGLEAMRFGTPVIAVSVGGIKDWLEEGKTGLEVPYNDSAAIAKAIDRLMENPKLMEEIEKESKKRYVNFYRPHFHVHALLHLFEKEIEKKSPRSRWGRLTLKGPEELEEHLRKLIQEVIQTITQHIPATSYQALLLIGGYGKGEGGYEIIEGRPFAHNNLDFLLISSVNDSKNLKQKMDALLTPLMEKYHIGFDFSVISYQKLRYSPNLLIWHEMYHGHKLLLGNENVVAKLPFESLKTVPKEEFWALMINRGSLLIINQCLIEQKNPLDDSVKKILIKHLMKTIIGFGDALLYALDDYHWSYEEKRLRIFKNPHISKEFRGWYEEAANFRFQPDYGRYLQDDIVSWMNQAKEVFSEIFLRCESKRLNIPHLEWNQYLEDALAHSLTGWSFPLRKVKGLLNPPKVNLGNSLVSKLGFWLLTPHQRLAIIFPFIAFNKGDENLNAKIGSFLNTPTSQMKDLELGYLRQWAIEGDVNLPRSLKEWNLSLS